MSINKEKNGLNTNKNRSLIKGVGIYAVGTFGTKILSFLIVPLYTYYISTSDMGVYDIILSTISLLTPIVTMQISDAAYRWIIRDDVTNKNQYIYATMQVLIINCLIAVAIILSINHFYEIPYYSYLCLILVLSRALQTIQKILRGLRQQWLFAISGIVYTVVFLTLNVFQLCVLQRGIKSLFQSAVVANIIALLVIITRESRFRFNIFRKVDLQLVFELYRYSIPLVPNYLSWWVINSSDRYIVTYVLGSSATGLLAVAHKFPSMLQTILNLFTSSWQDVSVADTERNIGEYYTFIFRKFYILVFSVLWGLIPATKVIIMLIMSDAYKNACDYVAFYYLGSVFQSFASFYGVGYLKSKKTKGAFSTSVYGAIVNAVVNIGLIKVIGLQAASISTFIGFGVMWLIRERQNRKELGIEVNWREFAILTLLAVLVCVLSNTMNLIVNIGLLVVGTLGFMIFNKKDLGGIVIRVKNRAKKKYDR